jgi:hypothetical protein
MRSATFLRRSASHGPSWWPVLCVSVSFVPHLETACRANAPRMVQVVLRDMRSAALQIATQPGIGGQVKGYRDCKDM